MATPVESFHCYLNGCHTASWQGRSETVTIQLNILQHSRMDPITYVEGIASVPGAGQYLASDIFDLTQPG